MDSEFLQETNPSIFTLLEPNSGNEFVFSCPLSVETVEDVSDFDILFLEKANVFENDIRITRWRDEEESIAGWLIPILALQSVDHSEAENSHFLKAASIALTLIFKILPNQFVGSKVFPLTESVFDLDEIFHPNTIIYVYKTELFGGPICERNFPPGLFSLGYFARERLEIGDVDFAVARVEPVSKKVHLNIPSKQIQNYGLIYEIINDVFPVQKNSILNFFLLYQVIELFIDEILENEYRISAKIFSERNFSREKVISELKKLNKNMEQGHRIVLLFSEYSKPNSELIKKLLFSCNELLSEQNKISIYETSCPKALFTVRNTIFHGYGGLLDKNEAESKLDSIVVGLLAVLDSLICSFEHIRRDVPQIENRNVNG